MSEIITVRELLEIVTRQADKIAELENVADNQIWPSLVNFNASYVRGYEQATHDIARKLKGGDK